MKDNIRMTIKKEKELNHMQKEISMRENGKMD